MRFTWWTYRVAIHRAFEKEYQAFCDHYAAYRGEDPWFKLMCFTNRLKARYERERKKKHDRSARKN